MRTISVRLDDQSEALLAAACARTGLSLTDVVKAGIARVAESAATPHELAERLGLIGSFASEIGDLGARHADHLKRKLRETQTGP